MLDIPEEITDTSTRTLYEDLVTYGASKRLLIRCKKNVYHDFKSPMPSGDIALLDDLKLYGPKEMIELLVNGKYDATKEECIEWMKSQEGVNVFRQLARDPSEF